MSTYYGDFQWKLVKYIISKLQDDTYLKSIISNRVYAQHISTIENPTFPCVTVSRVGAGSDLSIHQINYVVLAVDVWSKKGIAELWRIYADHDAVNKRPVGVRSLLSEKTFDAPELIVHLSKEETVLDNLYEDWSKTWHMHAQYRVYCAAKNVD